MQPTEFANQVVESCESTNDLARLLGEAGYPHGTWVSSREQTRGRGRLGREWKTLEGNLFLSVVVRLTETRDWSWVPLLAGVAVAKSLTQRYPILPICVKWPNDLWINGAKLGGLLCEAVGSRERSFIIVGIGINCVDSPSGLDQRTTSLTGALREQQPKADALMADDIRTEIISAIVTSIDEMQSTRDASIARLHEDYARFAALRPGARIQWKNGQALGETLGLGEFGELRVRLDDGHEEKLFAEDVSVQPAAPR